MNIGAVDLNLLIAFDAIWRTRSVSRAAQTLGVPQPTLSNALKRLRRQFDDALFVRTAHGMTPTPFAAAIAEPVAEGLAAIDRGLRGRPDFDPATASRRFTIIMTDIAEAVILPHILEVCRRTAPGVSIRTRQLPMDATLPALRSGEVDLAIGYIPALRSGVMQQLLFTSDYVCLVAQRHPTIRRALTRRDFLGARHAVAEVPGTGHHVVEKTMLRLGLEPSIGVRVPHFLALPLIVAASDMIATVPRPLGKLMRGFAEIRLFDCPVNLPELPIRQFWHPRFNDDPASKWLRAILKRVVARAPVLR